MRYLFLKIKDVRADSLLAFNEGYGTTVSDGNGNISGTITNTVWKTGEMCFDEKCLYFDGTGDLINFGDDADLDYAGSANFTLEGWFRTPDITSGQRTIIAKYNSATGTDGGYKVYMDSNGYLTFGIDSDQTSFPSDLVSTSATALDDNKWHHFAAVKTGTTSITLYVDGNQYAIDSTITASTLVNADSFYIGIDGDGSSNGFSGFLDEIKVYNSARTATEIKSDLVGTTPSQGTSTSFGPSQDYLSNGLVGYWKMDENTGSSASDSSGNGNTMTLVGMSSDWSSGKFGSTLTFSGSGHEAKSTQTYATVTEGTIEAWIFPTTSGIDQTIFAAGDDAGTERFIHFVYNAGNRLNLYVRLNTSANEFDVQTTTSISPNTWTHVVVTQSSGTPKLYINGLLSPSSLGRSGTATGTEFFDDVIGVDNTTIGYRDRTANDAYFVGKIDNLRLYNHALSPAEVQKLYNWAPGPVGWWKMDESSWTNNCSTDTVFDSSGNGNHADTCPNSTGPTGGVTGKFGNAGLFDGSTDYVLIPRNTNLEAINFTISMWANARSWASGDSIIAKRGSVYANMDWQVWLTATEIRMGLNGGADFVFDNQGVNFSTGSWHHVSITKDGINYKLFIDGVLKTLDTSTEVWTESENILIGSLYPGYTAAFDGKIDEVKIYTYARTPAQIIEDMNGGHPAPGSPIGSAVAYWKFDEGYGVNANDSSINANTLTFSTASWTNSGKFGKAFNGLTNVRASRADDSDLDFAAAEDLSFSLWFKSDSTTNPSTNEYLLEKGGNIAIDAIGYAIYTSAASDGLICFGIDDDTISFPEDLVCSSSDLYDNTWHHILAEKTGTSRLDLYVDGKPNGTPDTSISATGTLVNAATFYLGDTNATDGTDEFLGDIDEVKIFRSALTSDQVKVLYNQSSQTSLGALSTDSSNNPSNSSTDSYCPPGQGTACVPPVGHWKLDENTGTNAYDSSSNGNNSSSFVGSPLWAVGKVGSAMQFSGSTQGIVVTDSSTLHLTDFTIEGWFKTNATIEQGLVSKRTNWSTMDWQFFLNAGGGIQLTIGESGADTIFAWTGCTYTINTWQHVVVTKSGTSYTLYKNGSYCTGDTSAITWTESDNLVLGAINTGGGITLNGLLDDVKIYNYARTPAQIAWDYNRGGPVGWWKLDENTGTTLKDSSGNELTSQAFVGNTAYITGKFNTGLVFDGTDDVVQITEVSGNRVDLGLTTDSYSISGWFKSTMDCNTVSQLCSIISKDNGTGAYPFRINLTRSEKVEFKISDGTNTPAPITTASFNDGLWHHVVGVRDVSADTLYLYVDGKLVDSSNDTTTATTANDDDLSIGNAGGSYLARDLDGTVDDVRIYNYAITPQQVKQIMNEGAGIRFGPITGSP